LFLLQVRGEDDLLVVYGTAANPTFDEACATGRRADLGINFRLQDDATALRTLARAEIVLHVVGGKDAAQRVAFARRE
jgi:hypothetical protein